MARAKVAASPTLLAAFWRCRSGAVGVAVVAMLTTLIAACVLAVDVAKLRLVEARLQTALDAAALAGTRDINSATLQADIRAVFDANFNQPGSNATIVSFNASPFEDEHGVRRLALSAAARVNSALGRLLDDTDFDWFTVDARNETIRTTRGLELAMVLDNTGSMRSGTKMNDLRTAAHKLTDALFDGKETQPNLWVAIVPYVATVNVGPIHASWLRAPIAPADFAPSTWKGCVLARGGGDDQTDAPPSSRAFEPFLWPNMEVVDLIFSDYDYHTPMNIWPLAGAVDERNAAQNMGYGPNLGCGPAILPLTSAAREVRAKLDEMQPWHRGGTMANVGLVWGWRVLSPAWDGLWRSSEGRPVAIRPYDAPYTSKVVVLMTDGANGWYKQDYTAYAFPQEGRLGGIGINDRMLAACTALKNRGVVVYTITFGRHINSRLKALYAACASAHDQNVFFAGDKYFHAPTGEELEEAFGAIGGQLTELRLTQ